MADNIVSSMFGASPYQVQQQRMAQAQQEAMALAKLDPMQRAQYGIYSSSAQLARPIAGMMGMVDPAEQAAKQQQATMQGADTSTPEGLRALAIKFNQANMPQQAMAAAKAAQDMEATMSETELRQAQAEKYRQPPQEGSKPSVYAQIDIEKFTPESLRKFEVSGNRSDLVAKPTPVSTELKPTDWLKYSNQHTLDRDSTLSTLDTSNMAQSKISDITSNKNFGYVFGGYTEKALSKLAPGEIKAMQLQVESLKDQLKSAGLNLVKSANKAGIGAITEKEWPIFEGMIGKLDPSMDEKSAKQSLDKINAFFEKTKMRVADSYDRKWKTKQDFYDPEIKTMIQTKPQEQTSQSPKVVKFGDLK